MRWLALTLAVFLTASPLAEAFVDREASEPCPMASLMPDGTTCLTAPCPCDHSAPAAVMSQAAPTTLPGAVVCAVPAPAPRACLQAQTAPPAPGFPFAIDHPPDNAA